MAKKVTSKTKKSPKVKLEKEVSTVIPVVGIGASAGGLEALEKFFSSMPVDTHLGFVIVQHLDPDHKSILVELIQRHTQMRVKQIEDGDEVQPNKVYIIPPGFELKIHDNKLLLGAQLKPRGLRLPIDTFLKSLAEDKRDKAIGIILSGTGTDGTLGLRAIKAENGFVFVQSPETSKYDGMPVSAISTGIVDHILDADKMAGKLLAYVNYIYDITGKVPIPEEYSMNFLVKIFQLLRSKTGHDFSNYKPNTIIRRIDRRIKIAQFSKIEDYYTHLQTNTDELHTLFKDFLIGVTNFFRDKEAFENLTAKILPNLFLERPVDVPIRIWTPGCSTGEEAFSLAIIIKEYMEANKLTDHKVQIFATDIDKVAVEKARQAIYPDSISIDVSETRLSKFFSKEHNAYQVTKSIRDMIVFAEQSVVKDPPFSKVDLVSCRNLLIYMSNELQEKVTSTFHYALNQNGYLFLGSSETLGKNRELFAIKDKKWKLYQKKNVIQKGVYISDLPSFYPGFISRPEIMKQSIKSEKTTLKSLVENKVLNNFSPAAVLVDGQFDIVFLHGKTSTYLEPVQGIANMNILQMARPELKIKLSVALNKAFRENKPVIESKLYLKQEKNFKYINIHILPVETQNDSPNLFLIVFEDITEKEMVLGNKIQEFGEKDLNYINNLEQELKRTKDYLQSIIEEAETTNEELKATNEELQSSNEELQSTNEELETSKEELQSINEELITVNTEHQNKIQELSDINNDVSNYLSSTGIATIFLDLQLKIKKFTPMVAEFFNLISADLDRPIANFTTKLHYPNFLRDIESVISTLNTVEKEIHSDNKSYICRILPYRTLENNVNGVVITFVDITNRKKYEEEIEQNQERYQRIFNDSPNAILIHDMKMNIIDVNVKAEEEFGYSKGELLKKRISELYIDKDEDALNSEKLLALLEKNQVQTVETIFRKKDGSPFFAEATPSKYMIDGNPILHLVVRNITKEKMAQSALKESEEKFRKAFHFAPIGMTTVSLKGNFIQVNNALCNLLGFTNEELMNMTFQEITHPDDLSIDLDFMQDMINLKRDTYQMKKRYFHKDGSIVWALLSVSLIINDKNEPQHFISQIVNIGEQQQGS